MNREEVRHNILSAIDRALSHTWLVSKGDQAILRAARQEIVQNDALVDRLGTLIESQPHSKDAEAGWRHRWKWSYTERQGGYWMRLPDGRWMQHANENGQDYFYSETQRTEAYIQMQDLNRPITVRLWDDHFDQQQPGVPGWSSGLSGSWE